MYSNKRHKGKMRTILSIASRQRTFQILSITLWEVEKEIETFSFEFKRNDVATTFDDFRHPEQGVVPVVVFVQVHYG